MQKTIIGHVLKTSRRDLHLLSQRNNQVPFKKLVTFKNFEKRLLRHDTRNHVFSFLLNNFGLKYFSLSCLPDEIFAWTD